MSLSDVTIVITAGHRSGYLWQAVFGTGVNLPECKIVIVNDDDNYNALLHGKNVIWRQMPNDTFLTRKRNAGISLVDTEYTLIAADDFDFDIQSRATVIKMKEMLEEFPEADVVAGRVNNRRYEGFLTLVPGEYIKEARTERENVFHCVDIAANFFLARTKVLREVPWDETIGPIGGEHADWFLDMKAANKIVIWGPGLNINEQPKDSSKEEPGYRAMRNRAYHGHELMLKKRGVKRYYGFDEEVK
jgi:hypothetical protein